MPLAACRYSAVEEQMFLCYYVNEGVEVPPSSPLGWLAYWRITPIKIKREKDSPEPTARLLSFQEAPLPRYLLRWVALGSPSLSFGRLLPRPYRVKFEAMVLGSLQQVSGIVDGSFFNSFAKSFTYSWLGISFAKGPLNPCFFSHFTHWLYSLLVTFRFVDIFKPFCIWFCKVRYLVLLNPQLV